MYAIDDEQLNFTKEHLANRRKQNNLLNQKLPEVPHQVNDNVKDVGPCPAPPPPTLMPVSVETNARNFKRTYFLNSYLCKRFPSYTPRLPNFNIGRKQGGLHSAIYRCKVFEEGINWQVNASKI
ncbi:hypothetical protein ROZALSC1DRAFT_31032 [Rozella allomycis CSF55]|uniref:Uncharacterized protein n=1 Tax=Rozella allomycis (strain CSF55) TaxID=988480 RepID=A0A075B1W7_ROZAC|nr:hypothetical protein O9G_005885 [Rozella allomycis CSF55]RKP17135.1 hypothetical protein ROZALSC1DRAFT_31032 [Rozella allomycis CSF55]|eukprot:EPZ34793.1 hypothetical protein O9G_005885 [Rozella allomycis CSF55]